MNCVSRAMIDAIYQFDDPAIIKASPNTVITASSYGVLISAVIN
jgi:hypothetical protein